MGDNDYENLNGWIPILLQNPPGSGQFVRDSWVSWWEHRSRGSLGGVDCPANIGTPIYAPANCYIVNTDRNAGGSGGRTVTATFNDGWKDQYMHLQSFVTAGSKQKGTVIGYTGNSVADGYDPVAQHLHFHRIDPGGASRNYNGVYDPYGATARRNPFYYFTGSGGAGGGVTPIEDDMTPEEHALLVNVASRVDEMKWQMDNRVLPRLGDLAEGRGAVHSKLDTILWALTDPNAGLRLWITQIKTKLGI